MILCRVSAAAADNTAFSAFLLESLPQQTGAAGVHAARVLLQCLQELQSPFSLLQAAAELLDGTLKGSLQNVRPVLLPNA